MGEWLFQSLVLLPLGLFSLYRASRLAERLKAHERALLALSQALGFLIEAQEKAGSLRGEGGKGSEGGEGSDEYH